MIDNLPHTLYFVVMALAVSGWLALILFPHRPWANLWYSGVVLPLLLCFIYIFVLLTFWFLPPAGAFSEFFTLDGIYALFGNRGLLLVGWTNLIAMDLVAGAWLARKAAQIRMPNVYLLPCLVLTFVFAGFGFALFSVLAAIGGGWSEIAKFEAQPPVNSSPVVARPSAARVHPRSGIISG
jgi:hypothetical protein